MQKMHISFIKDLKNFEFAQLFSHLDARLDEENFESSVLQKTTKKVKSHVEKLVLLKHANPSHPLTTVINDKLRTRTDYLACMRMKIDANLLSNIPEERVAADTLKRWLERYKKDLYPPSIDVQGNVVRCVMQDRDQKEFLRKAFILLQLNSLLEDVLQLTNEINMHDRQRLREKTHNQMEVAGLRDNAYKDLQIAVNAITVSYSIADDEEQQQLADLSVGINYWLRDFRTKLLSRRTKSKNKRELKVAVEELIDTTKEPEPVNNNLPMVIYAGLKKDETSTS